VTVHIGDQGLILVDTGAAGASDRILAAIRRLSDKPIRYVINTTVDADHTGGNEAIGAKAGRAIPGRNLVAEGASMVAHENVLNRMSTPAATAAPAAAWPTDVFFTAQKDLYLSGTAIQIMHQPSAHTDGDSVVYFRRADVIAAGDVIRTAGYPVIDLQRGGSITGVIDALNHLLDVIVAGEKGEGGTMVVPGHGRISDEAEVVEYRDMVTIVRDRVQDLMKKGQTLAQIRAARPTFEYDGLHGGDPAWTPYKFVEAVYKTLSPDSSSAGSSAAAR
jgi:glyoxylase-like metal-dependent hydrolase (beta-lactamase superfamily II)